MSSPSSSKHQEIVEVKIKKLDSRAVMPTYSKEGDAGLDITATDVYRDLDYKFVEFSTSLSLAIPEGYVGLVFPRSSISKTSHSLRNAVAVIDSNFRGELKLRFSYDENNEDMEYVVGDRVGQLVIMPIPKVNFIQVEKLDNTDRGQGGFGSSGR